MFRLFSGSLLKMETFYVFFLILPIGCCSFRQDYIGSPKYITSQSDQDYARLYFVSEENVISCIWNENGSIVWQKHFSNKISTNFDHTEYFSVIEHHESSIKLMIFSKIYGNLLFSQNFESDDTFTLMIVDSDILHVLNGKHYVKIGLEVQFRMDETYLALSNAKIIGAVHETGGFKIFQLQNNAIIVTPAKSQPATIQLSILSDHLSSVEIDEYGVLVIRMQDSCYIGHVMHLESFKFVLGNNLCTGYRVFDRHAYFILLSNQTSKLSNVTVIYKHVHEIDIIQLPNSLVDVLVFSSGKDIFLFENGREPKINSFDIDANMFVDAKCKIILENRVGRIQFAYGFVHSDQISFLFFASGTFYRVTNNKFVVFRHESFSPKDRAIGINIVNPLNLAPENFVQRMNSYMTEKSSFKKFLIRLCYDITKLLQFIKHFNILEAWNSLYMLVREKITHHQILAFDDPRIVSIDKNGLLQSHSVENGDLLYTKMIDGFFNVSQVEIQQFSSRPGRHNLYAIYGWDEFGMRLHILDISTGSDVTSNVLLTHQICSTCEIVHGSIFLSQKCDNIDLIIQTHFETVFIVCNETLIEVVGQSNSVSNHLYYFQPRVENGKMSIRGYFYGRKASRMYFNKIWSINLHAHLSDVTIATDEKTVVVEKDDRVHVSHSKMDRYRHDNHLAISYVYHVNETSNFRLIYLHTKTGAVLYEITRKNCMGPTHLKIHENYIFAVISNNVGQHELLVIEVYKNKSLTLFRTQLYLLDIPPLTAMSVAGTTLGLRHPSLFLAISGYIFVVSSKQFTARRSLKLTNEEMEEGVIPYMPIISTTEMTRINRNISLFDVTSIIMISSSRESIDYFCAVSHLGIYCDAYQGIGDQPFDTLNTGFDQTSMLMMQAILSITTVVVVYYFRLKITSIYWNK
ncbi:hypothetical protein RF11_12204 [Thelohanellus kitauei]|uniref:ER membrane protein complex subunit 1 n=1 Tax=Thelohanellus kitauei TaxID=669202 RepID=A0A0C2MUE1_THEKT|nr:hypothetical protein RF11_12204 [Thelohanellus kitauei]